MKKRKAAFFIHFSELVLSRPPPSRDRGDNYFSFTSVFFFLLGNQLWKRKGGLKL